MPFILQNQRPIEYTIPLNLAGPAYSLYSSNINAQTCINWYPVRTGPDAKTPAALFPTHGTILVNAVGQGPHRGAIEHKGVAYFLSGTQLISMSTAEVFTAVSGNTSSTTGKVSMASNGAF